MSICPKNKSSKARRDSRRANWKMSAPNLVKCSKVRPSDGWQHFFRCALNGAQKGGRRLWEEYLIWKGR